MKEFLSDVKELRRRARQHLEQGPVDLSNMLETFDPEKALALIGESYRV